MREKRFQKNNKYFTIGVYVVLAFALCAIIAKLVFNFSTVVSAIGVIIGVLAPFVGGIILAYLINPLYKFFDFKVFGKLMPFKNRRGLRKTLSLLLSYIIVLGIIALIVIVIIPQLASSITSLVELIKDSVPKIQEWITSLEAKFKDLNLEIVSNAISNLIPTISSSLSTWAQSIASSIVDATIGVVSGLVNAFLAIFVSIYILSDKINLERGVRNLYYAVFEENNARSIAKLSRECSTIFSNYFTGKIFDSLLIGVLCLICMSIFNLPYALMISVIVFITNIIPYFGPIVGAVLGCLVMLMFGWKQLIIFLIIDIVIQQLDGNVIGPKIIGDTTGLRPIWVLFAITVGSWAGGVFGMLIGVPIMAIISHIVIKLVNRRLRAKGLEEYTEEKSAPKTLSYSDVIVKKFKDKKRKKAIKAGVIDPEDENVQDRGPSEKDSPSSNSSENKQN